MLPDPAQLLRQMIERIVDLMSRLPFAARQDADDDQIVFALPRPDPEDYLTIPVRDTTPDETEIQSAQRRGQFLARQEMWDTLLDEIREHDMARSKTPGDLSVAELMAHGARSDVVLGAEHALEDGHPSDLAPLTDGILALEGVRKEYRNDPYMSLLVAHAHLEIGWAWRGTICEAALPKINRKRCLTHFARATKLMLPHCGAELNSPLVAAAQCALLAAQKNPGARVSDDYEDLIDLDPHNPRHMRALGCHLLPRWFGSYQMLEIEARRTAARTYDIWGNGGYAWVYFDAIGMDENACTHVDLEFFIDGLHDIVAVRPDQETVNLLAAYCAIAIRHGQGLSTEADLPRLQITECADWLVREHLTEIHPMVWAHALDGFDNTARVSSAKRFAARGRRSALQSIADMFSSEIGEGRRVTFTDQGPHVGAA